MQDRNVQFPQRYKLQKVVGTDDIYDLIPTPGEISSEGTFLNKANLLKDTTAKLFGLGTDAVPDDVLLVLSRFQNGLGNEYLWSKTKTTEAKYSLVSGGQGYGGTLLKTAENVRYYDSISLDGDKIVGSGGGTTYATNVATLIGKYVGPDGSAGFYNWAKLTGYYYPEDYTIRYSGESYHVATDVKTILYGYVNSPFSNAYPPAVDDGFTYNLLGQLANLGAKIETGSYFGTGTYGASNPSVLTFGFEPKLVIVFQQNAGLSPNNGYWGNSFLWTSGQATSRTNGTSNNNKLYFTQVGNSLSWYAGDAWVQMNGSADVDYHYIAIG